MSAESADQPNPAASDTVDVLTNLVDMVEKNDLEGDPGEVRTWSNNRLPRSSAYHLFP